MLTSLNPLMCTLKPQNNRPLHSTVIGTLAIDGWDVTFGTVRRGPSFINGQCTNFILYDMAL